MSWQEKAKKIVEKLSAESYAQSQKTRTGGKRKRHVPYSVPETAQRLIEALNRNDEELAKSIMMYDYDATRVMGMRDPARKPAGRRGHRTQAEHLSSIDWNMKDAKEALVNAVGMNDWRGVDKYTRQIEALEVKRRKSEHPGMKRSRGRGMPSKHIAGHRFGRGELPGGEPSKRYEIQVASGETLCNTATRKPQVFYTYAKAEAAFAKLRREHGPLPAGVRIVVLTGPESPPHPHRDPPRRRAKVATKKTKKFERCVKAVKKSRSAANPWAVCHKTLGKKSSTTLGKKARRDPVKLDKFTRAYLLAALWSSNDESDESGGEPLDKNYGIDDIAPPVLKALVQEAREFEVGYEALWMGRADDEQAGHDFWLTRNGHGAGFWDRPEIYGKREAEQLTKASKKYGEVDLYVGDDGQIWAGGYEKGTRGGR